MNLSDYFQDRKGLGILATADGEGKVNVAIYASPHVVDDQTIAFIMRDRLSHHNLQSNPHAAYLFVEDQGRHQGKRLHLTRLGEETDPAVIEALRRRTRPDSHPEEGKFLVTFRVDQVLPAVGTE